MAGITRTCPTWSNSTPRPTWSRPPRATRSVRLYHVRQAVDLRDRTGLSILGVGYTVYLGSEKPLMLYQAAQAVNQAHRYGLITVLWMYPVARRSKTSATRTWSRAAGVAAAIGSDFAKVNPPKVGGRSTRRSSVRRWRPPAGPSRLCGRVAGQRA